VPLCAPQIPYLLTCDRSWVAAAGCMARPLRTMLGKGSKVEDHLSFLSVWQSLRGLDYLPLRWGAFRCLVLDVHDNKAHLLESNNNIVVVVVPLLPTFIVLMPESLGDSGHWSFMWGGFGCYLFDNHDVRSTFLGRGICNDVHNHCLDRIIQLGIESEVMEDVVS
jgi:hypothetical protein